MNKKKLMLKISALFIGLSFLFNDLGSVKAYDGVNVKAIQQVSFTSDFKTTRLGGNDRFDTSLLICDEFVNLNKKSGVVVDTVILANAFSYADALASAPLTREYNAPILLTPTDKLDSRIEKKIKDLKIKKVVIVGGTGVVSNAIENNLKAMGIEVKRLSGKDRTETSMAIANDLKYVNGCIIVDGYEFTKALALSTPSAILGMPMILTKDKTNFSIKDVEGLEEFIRVKEPNAIDRFEMQIYLPSIEGRVTAKDELKDCYTPIVSKDIFRANMDIATRYPSVFGAYSHVIMTTPNTFADSLSAVALAVKQYAPIIYVGDTAKETYSEFAKYDNFYTYYMSTIFRAFNNTKQTYLLGGKTIVPDNAYKKLTGKY